MSRNHSKYLPAKVESKKKMLVIELEQEFFDRVEKAVKKTGHTKKKIVMTALEIIFKDLGV